MGDAAGVWLEICNAEAGTPQRFSGGGAEWQRGDGSVRRERERWSRGVAESAGCGCETGMVAGGPWNR